MKYINEHIDYNFLGKLGWAFAKYNVTDIGYEMRNYIREEIHTGIDGKVWGDFNDEIQDYFREIR